MANDINTALGIGDEFQELLDGISGLSTSPIGKRGGGRSTTNNIGADVLGYAMLQEFRNTHHVDISKKENRKVHYLFGIIDQKSFDRARQISKGTKVSYDQVGVLAVSIEKTDSGTMFFQWWKGVVVKGVLTFDKIERKGADYALGTNQSGQTSFWKLDSKTGQFQEKNDRGDYIMFPFNELVSFEEYLNEIVKATEYSVSFPEYALTQVQGLAEILANVNLNSEILQEVDLESSDEDEEDEE